MPEPSFPLQFRDIARVTNLDSGNVAKSWFKIRNVIIAFFPLCGR